MLEFWLISTFSCYACGTICNKILENEFLNRGYIAKWKKNNKRDVIKHFIKLIIPIYNILHTISGIVATTLVLKSDKFFFEAAKSVGYRAEEFKRIYKSASVKKNEIKDSYVLDGASNEQVKSEFKQLRKEKNIITEEDNILASAMIHANDLLAEIECNVELKAKEKKKLLSSLRRMCLVELTNKKGYTMNSLKKKFNNILDCEEKVDNKPKQIVKK